MIDFRWKNAKEKHVSDVSEIVGKHGFEILIELVVGLLVK